MQMLRKTEEMIYPVAGSHPRLHRLSETDQVNVPIPQLFYYKQGPPSSQVLKSSLSKALAFFYPVAGRLVERSRSSLSTGGNEVETQAVIGAAKEGDTCDSPIRGRKDVKCSDEGALFCEAWTDSRLDTYLPDLQSHPHLSALLPLDPKHAHILLKVQVTNFACGGMCLCVVALHNIFDGPSNVHFMECLVELANGKESISIPPYISHTPLEIKYNMPRELTMSSSNPEYQCSSHQNQAQVASNGRGAKMNKVFHFTSTFIDTLIHEISDDTCNYSSFECIAAFMWRNITLARGFCSNEEVCLFYSVNGRENLKPSLPPNYFGNASFRAQAVSRASDLVEKQLSHTMQLIRKASSSITDEHMRKVLKWSTEQSSPMPLQGIASPNLALVAWTSYPLYDFNFGWGNPICCRPRPCIPFDFVGLLPSSLGKGNIEAVVALDEECMQKLESLISSRLSK